MRKLAESIASMFRALVMLAILGGGAYLAIEHTPILEIAREKFSEWQNRPAEHDWGGGEAPAFDPSDAGTAETLASHEGPSADASSWPQVSLRATDETDETNDQFETQQAGFQAPVTTAAGEGEWEYLALERRLRQMGVSSSLLESGGTESRRFRFLCRISPPGGTGKDQVFQAVAADPLEAMRQVVSKVDRWRSYGEQSSDSGGISSSHFQIGLER